MLERIKLAGLALSMKQCKQLERNRSIRGWAVSKFNAGLPAWS
jgi:hypothetical protein